MVNVTRQSVSDVDAVILMVEPIAHVGRQEEALLNQLRQAGEPVILACGSLSYLGDVIRLVEKSYGTRTRGTGKEEK